MITAKEVRLLMNQAGRCALPFLFGIDYEMERGFFIPHPLEQQAVLWRVHAHTNISPALSKSPLLGSLFKSHPVDYATYSQRFSYVQQQLLQGNSFLTNLTLKTPITTDYTLQEILLHSRSPYGVALPNRFVCFSPETFVRIKGTTIYSNPMKGTIRCDVPHAEKVILADYKERAEHNTIVDFIRSDLSRLATQIKVDRFRYIDRIETSNGPILQVSSQISGELPADYTACLGDILFTLLPAGSISGAPKVSTCKIIAAAEQEKRGYYSGVFGYYDGSELDSAVMIRYLEQVNGSFYFRSGGGITINSTMRSEYEEVLEKVYLPFV